MGHRRGCHNVKIPDVTNLPPDEAIEAIEAAKGLSTSGGPHTLM